MTTRTPTGHQIVRHGPGDWRCTCGVRLSGGPYGTGRAGARDVHRFHRTDLDMAARAEQGAVAMTTRAVPALAEDVALRRLALARWSIHGTSQGAAVVGTSWADSSDDVRDALTALAEHHGWMGLGVPEDTPIVLSSPPAPSGASLGTFVLVTAFAAAVARIGVIRGAIAHLQAVEAAVAREASRVHRGYRVRQRARRRRNRR